MRSKGKRKNFDWGKGKYYLKIDSIPNNITLFRKTKEAAFITFKRYNDVGKQIEWLGKWNGKEFVDDKVPASL